jgi:glycyl-tRNA synthetase beta chain
MRVNNFLVELGTAELPPKALFQLANAFNNGIVQGLKNAHLSFSKTQVFATPRRLAVLVSDLSKCQKDIETEVLGPPVAAAFDNDGQPTKASLGFARKCNVDVAQLQQVDSEKGPRLAYRSRQGGKQATALLPEIVQQSLDALPIPKRMRWGSSRVEFVRPVYWLVMLYGKEVINCQILGQQASNITYGHRFHYNKPITLTHPDEYETKLRHPGHVIADGNNRKLLITSQVKVIAEKTDGTAVLDPSLLDEVSALVEWPVALLGNFDDDFLRLPKEALISSMKEHQKYFHLLGTNNEMLPHFITISNIESLDPAQVVAGNERVIRPRLADAAFFFDMDKKTPLDSRLTQLDRIVFQTKLGTVKDKSDRSAQLASHIANLIGADSAAALRAGQLSKADLVTHMVQEFPDLQGLMGQYYARHDKEPDAVATAIYEHYLPRFAGDALPDSLVGCAVSIADKLDTITGLFAIGQPPTGDKDPFAIRRAALGILRITVEKKLNLDLFACIELALQQHTGLTIEPNAADPIFDFMLDRFRFWFQEENIPTQVFQSVYARRPVKPLDFQRRVHAVNHFASLDNSKALAAANKRVSNILAKQGNLTLLDEVNSALLIDAQEKELFKLVEEKAAAITPLLKNADYTATLVSLAELRPAVDSFFDNVMVMAEDRNLRTNRLTLLSQLRNLFLKVADISLL